MSLFSELKRRNVFRVGIAYMVLSWLVLQVTDVVVPILDLPQWVDRLVLFLLLIGFPVVLVFAWAFELTPDGLKRERDIERGQSITPRTGKKLDRLIIIVMGLVIGFLLIDRFYLSERTAVEPARQAAADAQPTAVPAEPSTMPAPPASTAVLVENSIAVLPFVNMSADAENEFFSDGVSEEILNVLARIPELKVAARTSAFAFKGSNRKISDIARELGVNHVLEGSVRKVGEQVRVTAQLIKADDGFHLWSETYDRELDNIFAIQDEIAGAIAGELKVSLGLEAGAAGNLTGTRSIQAYEHYLQGMALWHLRTVASLGQAVEAFERAIELDPGFAKARAGLALTWSVYPGYAVMDYADAYGKATESANRALQLDPANVEALIALAMVYRYENDFPRASELFQRAIELNPSLATAHQWYGGLLEAMGDLDASLESYQRAWRLDPRSRIIGHNLAQHLNGTNRPEEAMSLIDEVLRFAPEFPDALSAKFHFALAAGNCQLAAETGPRVAAALGKEKDSTPVYLDLCQSDDAQARQAAIDTIIAWQPFDFAAAGHPALSYEYEFAILLVELGELDKAFVFLGRSDEATVTWSIYGFRARQSPNSRRFSCDPRFATLGAGRDIAPTSREISCDPEQAGT